jgi:hypothetical protein
VVGSVFRHPSVEGFFSSFGRASGDRRAPVWDNLESWLAEIYWTITDNDNIITKHYHQ